MILGFRTRSKRISTLLHGYYSNLYTCLDYVFVLAVCLQLLPTSKAASATDNYRWFCDLTMNPVVTLEWDSQIHDYVVPTSGSGGNHGYDPLNGLTRRRRLWEPLGQAQIEDDEEELLPAFLRGNNNNNDVDIPEFMYSYSEPAIVANTRGGQSKESRLNNSRTLNVQFEPTTPSPTVKARACDCWNSVIWGGEFYCPLPRTHCAIPNSPAGYPGCVDVQKQRRVVRSIWPVLVVWYASVLFCLSFTVTGRHALSCCIATIYPAWNRRSAERILRNDPHQANQMLLRHYRIKRRQWERRQSQRERQRQRRPDNTGPEPPPDEDPFPSLWDLAIIPRQLHHPAEGEQVPTALQLKTKIYKHESEAGANVDNGRQPVARSNNGNTPTLLDMMLSGENRKDSSKVKGDSVAESNHSNDNEPPLAPAVGNGSWEVDDRTCTICYAQLEDGDRVGALNCGHVFHVEPCLKHWLTRRNVCPLCLTEDIATPQFDPLSQQQNIQPIVIDPPAEESSSDVDRSSSRDDDSSEILESNNSVPVFSPPPRRPTNNTRNSNIGNGSGRAIELTSIFSRRNNNSNQNSDLRTEGTPHSVQHTNGRRHGDSATSEDSLEA